MFFKFSNKAERSAVFLLVLYLFYYVYRYIFKYSSSITSSTYTDTPLWIQSLKYLILSGLIVYIFSFSINKCNFTGKFLLNRFLLLLLIVQFLLLGSFGNFYFLLFFSLVLIPVYLLWSFPINYFSLERVLSFFWYFSVLYEAIQIVLYLIYGRLPALAHPYGGWLNVRFGGPLDDPNSFAIILSYYFFYHLLKYKGITRFFLITISSMMLFFTLSLTGIFSIIIATVIVCSVRYYDRKLITSCLLYPATLFLFLSVIIIPNIELVEKMVSAYLLLKNESIDSHLVSWNINGSQWCTFFGVCPINSVSEIGFLRLLIFGGIPAVFIFIVLIVSSIIKLERKIKTSNLSQYPFFVGCIAYLVTFFISNLNLPMIFIFPTMGVLSIILIVANSKDYNQY